VPHTKAEKKALNNMRNHYGREKGEQVFYASVNKGNFGKASQQRHRRSRHNTKRSR